MQKIYGFEPIDYTMQPFKLQKNLIQILTFPIDLNLDVIFLNISNKYSDEPLKIAYVKVNEILVTYKNNTGFIVAKESEIFTDAIKIEPNTKELKVEIEFLAGSCLNTLSVIRDISLLDIKFIYDNKEILGQDLLPTVQEVNDRKAWAGFFGIFASRAEMKNKQLTSIAFFGDSITHQNFIVDSLRKLFLEKHLGYFPVNCGIGGNRLLSDTKHPSMFKLHGDSGLKRFEEVMRYNTDEIIIFIGTNDLGFKYDEKVNFPTAQDIINGFCKLRDIARTNNVKVSIATILPRGSNDNFCDGIEQDRLQINNWLKNEGKNIFDEIFDFDLVLQDPQQPNQLVKAADFGDGLHISKVGGEMLALYIFNSYFQNK